MAVAAESSSVEQHPWMSRPAPGVLLHPQLPMGPAPAGGPQRAPDCADTQQRGAHPACTQDQGHPTAQVWPSETHPSPRVSTWLSSSEGMKSSSSSELKSLFFLLTAPPCRLHSTGWGEHTKANSLGKVHG